MVCSCNIQYSGLWRYSTDRLACKNMGYHHDYFGIINSSTRGRSENFILFSFQFAEIVKGRHFSSFVSRNEKNFSNMNKLFSPILSAGGGEGGIILYFKDTSLRHILQVTPVRYILSCHHGNKITKGTSQNLAQKKSEISE